MNAPTLINLSVSSASAGPFKLGTVYVLWSTVDAFFQFGGSGVVASTGSHPIKAGLDRLHWIDFADTSLYIAAIVASGTGVLYVSEYNVYPVFP